MSKFQKYKVISPLTTPFLEMLEDEYFKMPYYDRKKLQWKSYDGKNRWLYVHVEHILSRIYDIEANVSRSVGSTNIIYTCYTQDEYIKLTMLVL